ncbi:MAG: hypothetical protein GEU78_19575 [Actinobacteria bacterium]|nr:hypothetical protein [Actinomycetota bacterium]
MSPPPRACPAPATRRPGRAPRGCTGRPVVSPAARTRGRWPPPSPGRWTGCGWCVTGRLSCCTSAPATAAPSATRRWRRWAAPGGVRACVTTGRCGGRRVTCPAAAGT